MKTEKINKKDVTTETVIIKKVKVPKGKVIQNKKDPTIYAKNILHLPENADIDEWQIIDEKDLPKQKEIENEN